MLSGKLLSMLLCCLYRTLVSRLLCALFRKLLRVQLLPPILLRLVRIRLCRVSR